LYLHIKDGKNKQEISVGRLKERVIGNEWHLVPGTVAEGVGLLQAFQDGAHSLQDVVGHMQIPGNPRDERHAKIHHVDQDTFQDAVAKMFWVSLVATFSNFNCFLLCCAILILSCTYKHFCLAEGISIEMANIVFDKAAQKVIEDAVKHSHLVLLASAEAFLVINSKLLSYNNICCTIHMCLSS
jgi:hypothetical protein